MKKIIEAFRAFNLIRKNVHTLTLVGDIFDFVQKVSKEGKPMYCRIALLQTGSGKVLNDFVSLWAGVGESNPIDRLKQIRSQKEALEHLLEGINKRYELSKEDKEGIEHVIKCFNL